jgi:seryl-tRNA synthetase
MQDLSPAPHLAGLTDALLIRTEIDGVYIRTGAYEDVVDALHRLISRHRPAGAEVLRLPPVMSRRQIQKQGYLQSFPHLLGCISCLTGPEAEVRAVVGDSKTSSAWTDALEPADLVLAPAACYPVYPMAAARGRAPANGYIFDVTCDCFRREPSTDLDRLQSFRMREYVRIGSPDQIMDFRQEWMERAQGIARQLGLAHEMAVANDPFFGRAGVLAAATQRREELKFELAVPLLSTEKPTACMSFNYHRDYFGETWDLNLQDGAPAHTACVAFGMDRLAVALFAIHGLDRADWPSEVRAALD